MAVLEVITISVIASQKALPEEYIAQMSTILLKQSVIDRTLSFVVKKGKMHYACDSRLGICEVSIKNLKKETNAESYASLWTSRNGACRKSMVSRSQTTIMCLQT